MLSFFYVCVKVFTNTMVVDTKDITDFIQLQGKIERLFDDGVLEENALLTLAGELAKPSTNA